LNLRDLARRVPWPVAISVEPGTRGPFRDPAPPNVYEKGGIPGGKKNQLPVEAAGEAGKAGRLFSGGKGLKRARPNGGTGDGGGEAQGTAGRNMRKNRGVKSGPVLPTEPGATPFFQPAGGLVRVRFFSPPIVDQGLGVGRREVGTEPEKTKRRAGLSCVDSGRREVELFRDINRPEGRVFVRLLKFAGGEPKLGDLRAPGDFLAPIPRQCREPWTEKKTGFGATRRFFRRTRSFLYGVWPRIRQKGPARPTG